MSDSASKPAMGNPFVGVVFIMLGAFNLLHGWSLFDNADWLKVGGYVHLSSSADLWGSLLLIFGLLQLVAGIMQLRSGGAMWLGVVLASISTFFWFCLLFVAPFAAIVGTFVGFTLLNSLLSEDKG